MSSIPEIGFPGTNPPLWAVMDTLSNAVLYVDLAGRITYANQQVAKLFNIPVNRIHQRDLKALLPEIDLREIMLNGKSVVGRRLTLPGGTYLINLNPVVINGKILGAAGIFQDITGIQNEIDQLSSDNKHIREMKSALETILELSSDGIVAVNRDYVITMANRAFARFFDKEPRDIIGKHVKEVYGNPIFPRAMETGEPEYGYITTLNGHEIIANRVPIIKDGEIVGALGYVVFSKIEDLYTLMNKIKKLKSQLDFYKDELNKVHRTKYGFDHIIGRNRDLLAVKETARRVANSKSTVLICGESGTGKELFAHALHTESMRRKGPFIKVNCAAVPENLLEAELFGYQEGAFTGARKGGQTGKFELANGGTIFLDEIGDMSAAMQAKLLRVLQEKEVERLGDTRLRKVDVRVVSATNRHLEDMMIKGDFREDLYYRINVVTLNVPPLRERLDDLEALTEQFIKRFNNQFGQNVEGITAEVKDVFLAHNWPGNIRELENVIERAFNVLDSRVIQKKHLPLYLQKAGLYLNPRVSRGGLPELVEEAEKEAILDSLNTTGGNKRKAAQLLGISRAGLYKKLKRYQIIDS